MKKASELATLCGIKISLVFTDLFENIHTFSNTDDFELLIAREKEELYRESNLFKFTPADVRVPSSLL
jgi:hypothetical protein